MLTFPYFFVRSTGSSAYIYWYTGKSLGFICTGRGGPRVYSGGRREPFPKPSPAPQVDLTHSSRKAACNAKCSISKILRKNSGICVTAWRPRIFPEFHCKEPIRFEETKQWAWSGGLVVCLCDLIILWLDATACEETLRRERLGIVLFPTSPCPRELALRLVQTRLASSVI